jgi:hypothetical protein
LFLVLRTHKNPIGRKPRVRFFNFAFLYTSSLTPEYITE